jgi:hypothetical protein
MFCPQCGAPNEDEAVFCGNCGAVMGDEETPVEELQGTGVEMPEAEDSEYEIPAAAPPPPAPVSTPAAPPPPAAVYASRVPTPATSGLAIASLVLGIGGLTLLPLIGSIAAIILGYMARSDIRKRPGEVTGDGLAMAGLVMGWIAVGLSILGLLAGTGLLVCGVCGSLGAGGY